MILQHCEMVAKIIHSIKNHEDYPKWNVTFLNTQLNALENSIIELLHSDTIPYSQELIDGVLEILREG